jgi:hypothetical protein
MTKKEIAKELKKEIETLKSLIFLEREETQRKSYLIGRMTSISWCLRLIKD